MLERREREDYDVARARNRARYARAISIYADTERRYNSKSGKRRKRAKEKKRKHYLLSALGLDPFKRYI